MLWSMVLVLTCPCSVDDHFHPIIYQIFRDFMLKKTISRMTLLAALLLASCASSHSTNHQPTASSTEVAKKNEISITIR